MDISVRLRNERSKFLWAERKAKNIKKDINDPTITHVLGDLNVNWAVISEKDKYAPTQPAVSPVFYKNTTSEDSASFTDGSITVSPLFSTTPILGDTPHIWETITIEVTLVKADSSTIDPNINNLSIALNKPSSSLGNPTYPPPVSQISSSNSAIFSFNLLPTNISEGLVDSLSINYTLTSGETAPTASYEIVCRAMVI